MKIINLSIIVILLFLFNGLLALTPTQVYLEQTSLDEIVEEYRDCNIDDTLPFFLEIASHEDENFFGYHGSSTKYRLFQDVLRAVFEEVLDYDLPEDFYFLRIPGQDDFNIANSKLSFIETFGRKLGPELRETMIQKLVLDSFNNNLGTNLFASDFSEDEMSELEGICFDLAEFIEPLIDRTASPQSKLPKMNQSNDSQYIQTVKAKSKAIMDYINQKEEAIALPKAHSANIEKAANILAGYLPDPDNAQVFLYSTLSPQSLYEKYYILAFYDELPENFYEFLFPFNDTRPEQQNRIVCMNVALFGNYFRWDESSIYIFTNGTSIEAGEEAVVNYLETFFDEIGLPKKKAAELFNEGAKIIQKSGYQKGTLLQFFDVGGFEPLEDIDENTFVSLDFGKPIININSSDLVKGRYPPKKNDIDLQLRLIIGNDETLNPHGPYRIKRYDMLPKHISDSIIERMKARLQNAPVDPEKKEAYIQKLKRLWLHNVGGDRGQM